MKTPTATTTPHSFHPMGPSTGDLFDVHADLPALAALEQASCFLASVYHLLQDAADDPHPESIYGAVYLTSMAKAVVDSVVQGLMQQRGGAA